MVNIKANSKDEAIRKAERHNREHPNNLLAISSVYFRGESKRGKGRIYTVRKQKK